MARHWLGAVKSHQRLLSPDCLGNGDGNKAKATSNQHFLGMCLSVFGWQHHVHRDLHLFTTANSFALAMTFRLIFVSVKLSVMPKGPTARQALGRAVDVPTPTSSHWIVKRQQKEALPGLSFSPGCLCHICLLGGFKMLFPNCWC